MANYDPADFKLIRPVAITDAVLTSTSVPESTVAEYNAGTGYGLGAQAGITVGTQQTVYRSLLPLNTGHAPSSSPTWWQLVSVVYAAYNVATTYADGDIVTGVAANSHKLFRSVTSGNVGQALTDITKWQTYGATNARTMFDSTYGSQTSCGEAIAVVLTPVALVNSVFVGNLDAASVTLAQTDSGYSKTLLLNRHLVNSWYDFYYETLRREESIIFDAVPPYAASSLTLTISNPGGVAKCGLCVVGKSVTLGTTQWEVIGSLISYSGTTVDNFGNKTFLKRPSANRLALDIAIKAGYESEVFRILTAYSDEPLIFIGSTEYSMTMMYASLGSWQVPISNSGKTAPIELLGLT